MAIANGTLWEVRTTGSQNAGGGFKDLDPGTSIDYSQQDSPQLTLTDLATDAAGTGLSSATGGFTAAMVGNTMRISGGTLTAGWYQIVAFTSTNLVTIDRSAGASKSGGSGYVGGAFLLGGPGDGAFLSSTSKGTSDTVYIKSGTYTATNIIVCGKSYINICGYSTSRGSIPELSDRPVIDLGSYYFTPGGYPVISDIIMCGTSTGDYGVLYITSGVGYPIILRCKFQNNTAQANKPAVSLDAALCHFVSCEFVSTSGYAVNMGSRTGAFVNCYFHDSVKGIYTSSAKLYCASSVFSNLTDSGIEYSYIAEHASVIGCVFYNCKYAFRDVRYATNARSLLFINNIVTACTYGVYFDASQSNLAHNAIDYNCWNTTIADVTNCFKGKNDIVGDPLLVDPANEDFRLQNSSPCINAGMQLSEAGL